MQNELNALIEKASTPITKTRFDGWVYQDLEPACGIINGKKVGVYPIEQCRHSTAKKKNKVYVMFKVDGKRVKSSEIEKILSI